jgi:hypothetical protein
MIACMLKVGNNEYNYLINTLTFKCGVYVQTQDFGFEITTYFKILS